MKQVKPFIAAVCLVAVGSGSGVAHSRGARCHDVDADFVSQLATENCTSPLGLCGAGTIKHDALIKGPMFVTIDDAAPSAGMPNSEPPSVLSVSGERSITPHRGGTLTLHVVGVAILGAAGNLERFSEINTISGGTGRFEGATGTLNFAGQATSATTFAGVISGEVCLAR
jgi:hypothetical protein